MIDALQHFATWVASWLSAEAGQAGLFLSALVSATVLPGSSEVVMVALVMAYPALAWSAFAVALPGNTLGALLTFGMGHAARLGHERFQHLRWRLDPPAVRRLHRLGPPALFLSFVPVIGDAMVLAAGWLNLPFAHCAPWIAAGKALRDLLIVLGLQGLPATPSGP